MSCQPFGISPNMMTEGQVTAAAQEVAKKEPQVTAVVLYGSQARQTPHPYSDWDIAIISDAARTELTTVLERFHGLELVSPVVMSTKEIHEHRNHAGYLEAAIAREGVLLAGTWENPRCKREDLTVDHELTRQMIGSISEEIESAARGLAWADENDTSHNTSAIERSQNGAEKLAKLIIAGFGLTPRSGHDLKELAKQLRASYKGKRAGQEERERFASAIESLNGGGFEAHTATYRVLEAITGRAAGGAIEPKVHTEERICGTAKLQMQWLGWYLERYPESRNRMQGQIRKIEVSASTIMEDRRFEMLARTVRSAIGEWATQARQAAGEIEAAGEREGVFGSATEDTPAAAICKVRQEAEEGGESQQIYASEE